jgi:hypothetical protein
MHVAEAALSSPCGTLPVENGLIDAVRDLSWTIKYHECLKSTVAYLLYAPKPRLQYLS